MLIVFIHPVRRLSGWAILAMTRAVWQQQFVAVVDVSLKSHSGSLDGSSRFATHMWVRRIWILHRCDIVALELFLLRIDTNTLSAVRTTAMPLVCKTIIG